MPVPSRRLKDLIAGALDHHASQRWPTLAEVTVGWRGSYGYLTGYLSDSDDDDQIKLGRIQYLGTPTTGPSRSGEPAPTPTPTPSSWTDNPPETRPKPSTPRAPSTSANTDTDAAEPNPPPTHAQLH